jgi:hypothetical protein
MVLDFVPPEVFAVEPGVASLGRILLVRGAGFLGEEGGRDEATVLVWDGTFTDASGAATPLDRVEVVPDLAGNDLARWTLAAEVRGDALVSTLFGAARGRFEGTLTPLALAGRDAELLGAAFRLNLEVGPIVQVIYISFLPSFSESLSLFGLTVASPEIEDLVVATVATLYAPWSVDIRRAPPADFDANHVSVVELGGPDPNGLGLFGLDNSPGKDVGNLRLADRIGGANWETQADGSPGYGGVFVETLAWWSEHPPRGGERPAGAPLPDPLFDQVFDPVRRRFATRAEVRGEGEAARVAQVQRAIAALATVAGESAAHEIGHSLGLAQPDGPDTVYHDPVDEPGCLMDRGPERPFGERAALPGFAPTRFCHDAPAYLDRILPPR